MYRPSSQQNEEETASIFARDSEVYYSHLLQEAVKIRCIQPHPQGLLAGGRVALQADATVTEAKGRQSEVTEAEER